eukprot:6330902-Pyramimonas_sp.AAC.1
MLRYLQSPKGGARGGSTDSAATIALQSAHEDGVHHTRAWAAENAWPHFAPGEGRSTLNVVARPMICAEAH